jgi:hypothetical protein
VQRWNNLECAERYLYRDADKKTTKPEKFPDLNPKPFENEIWMSAVEK